MPYWSDGSELIPDMSFRTYSIIKDGIEIESMYADYSQVKPRADKLKATQIYDAGEFRMTSYGIGSTPKDYKSKYDLQKENQKELESVQDKNIKLWYSDDGENGILFTVLKFDPTLKCEECDHVGSWYMINEKYKIGACSYHCEINGNIGDGKLWKKKEYTDSDSLEGINPK